jgi:hypothetical protein
MKVVVDLDDSATGGDVNPASVLSLSIRVGSEIVLVKSEVTGRCYTTA